ncbi:hypothetical protein LT343_27505 [Bacillus toyonensis]|uniref:hypothetical protein n=1 Tax=Bacillus toyonensis TaxID=155322 RepID=UPI001EDFEB57|nr:hypothetical protein [Bacillus toyonensis]MCG3797043.1 hypothetical protein [Bacillus toyonensis]
MLDSNFNRDLKTIIHYILDYGIKNVPFKVDSQSLRSDKNQKEFVSKVHLGYMKAQNLIVQNLLLLGDKRRRVKNQIKEYKKGKKEKELIQKYEKDLEIIMYKERILRKVADTVAWALLGNDLTVIRRLYKHIPPVEIFNSNLKHDLEVVEKIFKENNTHFPLMTDITSFIQIGDVLVKDYFGNATQILELKEGRVNEEIEKIIKDYFNNRCDRKFYFELSEKDMKFKKQFERYIKQQQKGLKTTGIINSGKGKDDVTGFDIQILDEVFYTQHFDNIISSMLKEVDKKNYSIRTIDECLIVGVYNSSKIPIHEGFEVWKQGIGIDFPTINLIQFINSPVSFPLFSHPFSIDDKVKLANANKKVLMSLDIKKWFEILESKGLKVKLLTKKQTARMNTVPNHSKAFEYKGQAIEVKYGEVSQILFDGIFERMFNQLVRPSSIGDFIKHGLSKAINQIKQDK